MIRINLLPYWEKGKKEDIRRQVFFLAASFVLFILVLSSFYIYISWSNSRLEAQVKTMELRTAMLAKEVGDVEANLKKKRQFEQKLAVIEELDNNRLFALRLFREMSFFTPIGNVWLNKVAQKGTEVRLDGYARHNMAVAQFMKNVEKSGFLTDVDLVVSKREEVEKSMVQRFVVTGRLFGNQPGTSLKEGPAGRN